MTSFKPQLKNKSWYSKKYIAFIKSQPPLIQGTGDTVPHHVRIDSNAGIGMKPSDYYCMPLPKSIHDAFHAGVLSDREFFEKHDIDIYKELFKLIGKFMKIGG